MRTYVRYRREREMQKQRERKREREGIDRERGTSVEGGSEQCNERGITTRMARSDIELITCYLYYPGFPVYFIGR
jgi:hypothetical protein